MNKPVKRMNLALLFMTFSCHKSRFTLCYGDATWDGVRGREFTLLPRETIELSASSRKPGPLVYRNRDRLLLTNSGANYTGGPFAVKYTLSN